MRSRLVEIESEQALLDDFFRVKEAWLRYELPDGEMSARVRRLCFDRGDSAAALVIDTERRAVVLAEQFRYPAYTRESGWLLELPAGIVEADEDAESSIRRELLEEVGYHAETVIPIARYFPSPGGSSERISLFCALVTEADRVAAGGGREDEHESITAHDLPLADVDRELAEGRILDGKTLLALTWLQLQLARGGLPGMQR